MIEHQATFDPDNLRDIIDVYIKTRGPDLDIETLSNTIVMICPDNVETLGVLLNWSFFWLIHYPNVSLVINYDLLHLFLATDFAKLNSMKTILLKSDTGSKHGSLVKPHAINF